MGKPHPGIEAAVLDDEHEPLSLPAEGHLAIRPNAPSFFCAYWNNEEAYRKRMKNGWYITGDRVKCDKDGYFWFIRREDDAIISSGRLINPYEVEQTLIEHPAVSEAAVVGIPDPLRTSLVKAFVSQHSR